MENIYRSKNGMVFTNSIEALYEDAKDSEFIMYNKTGDITFNLDDCIAVFITTSQGVEDFNKFREDWCRWMGSCKDGYVDRGFSMWEESEGYWSDPIPSPTFTAIATQVIFG